MILLRTTRLLIACACVVAGMAHSGAATSASTQGYTIRLWQTEDGLPQNSVTSVLQTRDGYLWIGTYGGLARFDGVRFRNYDALNTPELVDPRVVTLFEDEHGALWIGHDSGVVTRYLNGHFEQVYSQSRHATERVTAISSDAAGNIWVQRDGGTLESVDGSRVLADSGRGTHPQVLGLARSADGVIYVNEDGQLSRLVAAHLEPLDLGPARHTGFVLGIGPAQADGVWMVRDWRIDKRNGSELTGNRGSIPWGPDVSLSTLHEMRSGVLAVGTVDQGLYLCPQGSPAVHLDHSNGLPQDWVRAICEDREGNLWVGDGSAGLVEVVPTPFSVLSPPGGWDGRGELAVAADHYGAVWIGTEGAGLYRYQDGTWQHFGQAEGLEHPFVWSIAETGDGSILAGTWGGGIFRLRGGRFERVPQYNADTGPVFALEYMAAAHELWIAGGAGLIRWPDGGSPQELRDVGEPPARMSTIIRDSTGVVWFGGSETGLGRIDHGVVRRFHKRDGLSSESILSLMADPDGTLWIGTAFGGLVRFKGGRFSTIGMDQGLPSNIICHIVDDGVGYLWLSTHHGLVRVAREELNQCADGVTKAVSAQDFDRNDGLPTIEFAGGLQAAGCRTADGRIWFPTSKGVVVVDPARLHRNPIPPPVVLESVRVDGRVQERTGAELPMLRLRPEHERIEFQYTALSLTAPGKVMFKYRLDGIDNDWVDAGTKRTATYSRLPAGRYVFHVIASNNDGVWNTAGASIACLVLPFFWETWWFITLCIAAAVVLVGWAVRHFTRRRLQRRLDELERRHAVERERARIARDIHDDIGATLTRITMLSQCLPRDASPNASERSATVVDQIYDTAREATRALDEIVWAVNPRHDSLEALVSYMGKFAQDYLGAAGLRCRLDVPVELPDWPVTSDVRHNLFLAFKETLNNTVKHAGASEVHIGLEVHDDRFVLTVTDDGRGFDEASVDRARNDRIASGNGIRNLQRRLTAIGGRCEISSQRRQGTRVAFVVGRHGSAPAPQTEHASTDKTESLRSADVGDMAPR